MRSKFDEQLKNLNEEMIQMGIMIENNIQKAIDALVNSNIELAKEIMEKDVTIDKKQRDIEGIKGDYRCDEDGYRHGENRGPCGRHQ